MKTLATALMISAGLLTASIANAASSNNNGNYDPPFDGVYGQQDNGPTRAQVQAELAQAKAQGLLAQDRGNAEPVFQGVYGQQESSVSRAQVKADMLQYQAQHADEVIEA